MDATFDITTLHLNDLLDAVLYQCPTVPFTTNSDGLCGHSAVGGDICLMCLDLELRRRGYDAVERGVHGHQFTRDASGLRRKREGEFRNGNG